MSKLFKQIYKYCRVQYSSFHVSSSQCSRAHLLDGKQYSHDILSSLKVQIDGWIEKGNQAPKLVAVIVGDSDAPSNSYVKIKVKAAMKVGITTETVKLPQDVAEDKLLETIYSLNFRRDVDGILIQMPLPSHISERRVCDSVFPLKDVDGFSATNIGRLTLNMDTFVPCTALAVHYFIKQAGIQTVGKNAVVCGRSKHVGLPISFILQASNVGTYGLNCTTTICHRHTPYENLKVLTKNADIIVTAAGVPNLIRGDMVKPGACVIDVGMTKVEDPKKNFVGDVAFDEVSEVAGYLTPVPGGVGPVTVAMLMKNTFKAGILNSYASSLGMSAAPGG